MTEPRTTPDNPATSQINAPWTADQVAALERFQTEGRMHPFTCGGDQHSMAPRMIPSRSGWHCPDPGCSYTQNWAHAFMADPTQWAVGPFGDRHGPTPEEVRDWIVVPDREMEQLRADLVRVQERACRSAENLRHAEARVAELEKLLADELTALGQPQQPTTNRAADEPTTIAPDPNQPAFDAVFAYIRSQPTDFLPATVVERNAMIWRAVHAALGQAQQPIPAELREQADAFRQTAIRRAILLSRHQGLLVAIREFIAEETTPTNGWGDGYRDAKRDLAEILDAFAPDAVDQPQQSEDAEAPLNP